MLDLSQPMSRRRFAAAGLLAMAGAGALAVSPLVPIASADEWCWDDPVISIDGRQISIKNAVYGSPTLVRSKVTAARCDVYVQTGVQAKVVSYTTTFFNEPVTFSYVMGPKQTGQPYHVQVTISYVATAGLPSRVHIDYPGGYVENNNLTTYSAASLYFEFS